MYVERRWYTYIKCRSDGVPFYVGKGSGKRIKNSGNRNDYFKNIVKKHGSQNIRTHTFFWETEAKAFTHETQLIALLNKQGLRLANFTTGGEGASGRILSDESRRKISKTLTGRKLTPEQIEILKNSPARKASAKRLAISRRGTKLTPEQCAAASARSKKNWADPAYRAKVIKATTGKKRGPEVGAKISFSLKNSPNRDSRRHKISTARKGMVFSEKHRAAISAAAKLRMSQPEARLRMSQLAKGRKASPQTLAKMSAARRGLKKSEAHKAAIGAGNRGKKRSELGKHNLREAWKRRKIKALLQGAA